MLQHTQGAGGIMFQAFKAALRQEDSERGGEIRGWGFCHCEMSLLGR